MGPGACAVTLILANTPDISGAFKDALNETRTKPAFFVFDLFFQFGVLNTPNWKEKKSNIGELRFLVFYSKNRLR
jgi:hypothetical protein